MVTTKIFVEFPAAGFEAIKQAAASLDMTEEKFIIQAAVYRANMLISGGRDILYDISRPRRLGGSYWDEEPDYPVADWKAAIENDDTRLGYWEWVNVQRNSGE